VPGVIERVVTTPVGDARLVIAAARSARGTLALGHGAGGGVGARDLVALAAALPGEGITVVRVEQPWRVAGKKAAPAPATLDRAWLAALADLPRNVPLAVGGRSAGARVACRTARDVGAAGVVALAFPLHPPGRPERSRLAELTGAGVPTLVLQGERDSFGRPDEFPAGPFELVTVAHANHGLAVPAAHDQRKTTERIVIAVRDWLGNVFAAAKR
jgi:predicted alpha/beta-hydrolase family hydrolase